MEELKTFSVNKIQIVYRGGDEMGFSFAYKGHCCTKNRFKVKGQGQSYPGNNSDQIKWASL